MGLDYNSILVLGGSFNPPTVAHLHLMLHALHHTHTSTGIFVPSSENYVARKCRKIHETLLFSESARRDMLYTLIKPYSDLRIELGEYGDDGRGWSYNTMKRIQDQFPTRKCAFIIGADNLRFIPKWHNKDAFFKEFYFVVTARNHEDTTRVIQSNEKLSTFRDKLILIPELSDEFKDMSSTQARKLLKSESSDTIDTQLNELLTPKVVQIARNSMREVI